jgi:hypothetical protein
MADNVPAGVSNTDQPGRPYYESLRTTLKSTLVKKRQLDEQLQAIEDNIYKMESSYLEETNGAGNIVRGFDGWVKGVVVGGDKKSVDDRKARVRVRDEDRIFSRSSMSWIRVCAILYKSAFHSHKSLTHDCRPKTRICPPRPPTLPPTRPRQPLRYLLN